MKNNCTKVGITGGIGSGKTTVAKIFSALGIHIYFSDNTAKRLMTEDEELINAIKMLFGDQAYLEGGDLNRSYIAQQIFNKESLRSEINALVHPAVKADFNQWLVAHKDEKYILQESALIFEEGIHERLDKVILVVAPRSVRIERILARDPHRDIQDIEKIIAKQWDDERKEALADFIIENDASSMLIPQVLSIHQQLISA